MRFSPKFITRSSRLLQADVQRDKRRPCHGLRRQPHYKGLFAIFPFSTFLLSLLGLFNATDLVNTMVDKLSGVTPQSATKFIEGQLLSITQSQAESAFTVGAIISILLALWGISGAFRSVMEAMNVMYEVEE